MLNQGQRPTRAGGAATPLLQLRGLTKRYPGVLAVDHVDLDVMPGAGHALVGENGAGKSTLLKMIAGAVVPDEGTINFDGTGVQFHNPGDARECGVSTVPQELSLVEHLSIAENVYLGQLPRRRGLVHWSMLHARTRELLDRLGVTVDPRTPLSTLGPALQQLVMIARGMASRGRLFILDEPTAALSDQETERLFTVLEELRADGVSYLYVTHRLKELEVVADRITVLRDGRVVTTAPTSELNESAMIRAMVGREVDEFFGTQRSGFDATPDQGAPALSVRHLSREGRFHDVSFDVGRGEIVGLAGLMGAGRTEVAHAIFGVEPADSGTIAVDGQNVRIRSPRDAIASGIVLTPEERKSMGLVLNLPIVDNVALPSLRETSTVGIVRRPLVRAKAEAGIRELRIKAPSSQTVTGTLSGGNQQKVVLAKWLSDRPVVYIFDEPTRGIDVDVKAEIYGIIGRLADQGAGVLMIPSEMNELLGISDRIVVLRNGEIAGEVTASDATGERVLSMAMGMPSMFESEDRECHGHDDAH